MIPDTHDRASSINRNVVSITKRDAVTAAQESVLNTAWRKLKAHPHFSRRLQWIQLEHQNGKLILRGCVPSFHLKQLAQEAMRGIDGVNQICNQIEVVNPGGLSSSPQNSNDVS